MTYYMQTVLASRARFQDKAERTVKKALNKQIEPVLKKVQMTHDARVLSHLIAKEPIKEAFKEIYTTVGSFFAKNQYKSLKSDSGNIITKEDDFDDSDFITYVDDFIQIIGAKMVTNVTDTTISELQEFISASVKQGIGSAKLAADLRRHFTDLNQVRSRLIARTEVARANNFGTFTAGEMMNIQLTDTWLHAGSSKDDRSSHVTANGQTIERGQRFNIDSGYTPAYPHDGTGGADEECNCNCTFYSRRKK